MAEKTNTMTVSGMPTALQAEIDDMATRQSKLIGFDVSRSGMVVNLLREIVPIAKTRLEKNERDSK